MSNRFEFNGSTNQSIDFREEFSKYSKYWHWFLFSVLVCVGIAFVYLRYTPKTYSSHSKIIIKDSESPSAETAILSEMGMLSSSSETSIQNELAILRSRRLMENVVMKLHLNVNYFAEGQLLDVEIYKDSPIKALVTNKKGSPYTYQVHFSNNKVDVLCFDTGETYRGLFGEAIDLNFDSVIFEKADKDISEGSVLVKFEDANIVANKYARRFSASLSQDKGSIIDLSISDRVAAKAIDILDQIVEEYNQDAIRDNQIIAENTSEFINERLDSLNIELDSAERNIENFKEINGLINIETESQNMVENLDLYKEKKQELNIQLDIAKSLKNFLLNKENQLLPSNLGGTESGINTLISKYNDLILKRNNLLSGSSSKNPLVVELNKQIDSLRENLFESLDRLIQNLQTSSSITERRLGQLRAQVASVPSKEREFRGVSRPQNIKEQLYLFLLQKREENSISYGVENIKAKVVDKASSGGVVSPKSNIILLASFILGLFIPFGIIFSRQQLDNKIRTKQDIVSFTDEISILGQIPSIGKDESGLIKKHDRSILAEAFRILTTSMQYVLAGIQNRDKKNTTIYVTSTVKGEGKTFTAFNLALTLCEGDNRVLIVGADLRNPQLQRYEEGAKVLKGVSDFIVSDDKSIKAYINQSKLHPNLSIVTSGSIPPNPSELLRNVKIDNMFKELKGLYDYVIVDTAPAMLVADTFLINRFADLTLYVARAGYTEKNLINFAIEAKESGKLSNVSFVLNDVKMSNFGYYGNKYGYTYAAEDNDKRKGLISRFKK
tara:strand:- start:10642 stop:12990 length:2349 start_codon:yes stop_codon:yes gene_type:complete